LVVRFRNTIRPTSLKGSYIAAGSACALLLGVLGFSLAFPSLTYKGVPLSILLKFIKDPIARQAYFEGDKTELHNRLDQLGVESEIKAFYRPNIQDEQALDLHIHQLLYDNTGYIGKAYRLNELGQLAPLSSLPPNFNSWFALAQQLQLAESYEMKDKEIYIITPQGSRAPFTLMSQLYTIPEMRQWASGKQTF
jgi:hypothetical protein